ncbi:MAG: ribonuclease HII [Mariprofundaceae bacterium]|nr:ribonuclease HII [Mariprofundaceae bacterium]
MLVCGVDEVGRGPLAGPVVCAAVVLAEDDPMLGQYRDSKKVSEKKRLRMYHHLRQHAKAYKIASASVQEIDQLNILEATMLAMRRAVLALNLPLDEVLIDGNRCPSLPYASRSIIGGDDLEQSIAAASIIAKVVRDRYMHYLDSLYPQYAFARHKGYGTVQHLAALKQWGSCPVHRQSFKPVRRYTLK